MDTTRTAPSTPWALGDYHRFATQLVWGLGAELVEACGIGPGDRVLDVAAGSGNAALRAAEAGADVVASDITPENFEAGRREAARRGLQLEWVEADAQALPFADASFDAVISCVGAIFAPDQRAVAREMLRVCRPGGTIGMVNFLPEGNAADFFSTLGSHMPPSDAPPPVLWGSESHLHELFGDAVTLRATRGSYDETVPGGRPDDYVEFFKQTFGPVVGLYAALGPDERAALDRDFHAFAERGNAAPPGEPVRYPYEYLLVVARRR